MGYIQDLEKELREKIDQMDMEALIKFFKDKVLESYRNGLRDSKRAGKSAPESRKKNYGQA
jgi:hypothetical protein